MPLQAMTAAAARDDRRRESWPGWPRAAVHGGAGRAPAPVPRRASS